MLKIYGIHGRTQALIKIPVNNGRAWLECEFKHGRIGAGIGNRPATYPTRDETEQNIIENSPFFNNGIFLHMVAGDNDGKKAEQAPEQPALKAEPSVFSREEAVAYLKANGAKAANLKDDTAIQKYMEKIGVFFPNFSF